MGDITKGHPLTQDMKLHAMQWRDQTSRELQTKTTVLIIIFIFSGQRVVNNFNHNGCQQWC